MRCETYSNCGPSDDKQAGRCFLTADEKKTKLEEYKEWLDNESKGVEEAIAKIKEAS